jgi:hypothetical protein
MCIHLPSHPSSIASIRHAHPPVIIRCIFIASSFRRHSTFSAAPLVAPAAVPPLLLVFARASLLLLLGSASQVPFNVSP